jgi:signal transduction histidine kinase
MELEKRVEKRTQELRTAQEEVQRTNSELLQLTLELEDRVAQRTAEMEAKNEELKLMSQQLWQTAKLATMGELAASIAHELNNPLATVSVLVESLVMQLPSDDPKREDLQTVEQELERMSSLIVNLLQFSRRSQQQISTLDVRDEIKNTLELVYYHLRNKRVSVEQEFEPDIPMVHADRQQLRQLFLNLFTNASDAMPQGGTLTIRANSHLPNQVVIEIIDTGVGIALENLSKVTEPFFTTKPEGKGTGLGLSICRRIVQEHNGSLNIRSEVGRGTTVSIALPISRR